MWRQEMNVEVYSHSSEPALLFAAPFKQQLWSFFFFPSVDHSRIRLQLGSNDYINASLITVEEAQRNYILTQVRWRTYCHLISAFKNQARLNCRQSETTKCANVD